MLVRAYIASSRTWVPARREYWENCPSARQLVWKKARRTESRLPPATNSLLCLSKVRECSTAYQMPLKLCRGKAKIWGLRWRRLLLATTAAAAVRSMLLLTQYWGVLVSLPQSARKRWDLGFFAWGGIGSIAVRDLVAWFNCRTVERVIWVWGN